MRTFNLDFDSTSTIPVKNPNFTIVFGYRVSNEYIQLPTVEQVRRLREKNP